MEAAMNTSTTVATMSAACVKLNQQVACGTSNESYLHNGAAKRWVDRHWIRDFDLSKRIMVSIPYDLKAHDVRTETPAAMLKDACAKDN